MTNYYVVTPFEVMTEAELIERISELKMARRKVMAIVYDCKDYNDFKRKYFKD